MPDVSQVRPGRRVFARIDRFECACPHCGRLVFAGIDRRFLPKRLQDTSRARAAAKQRPRAASVLRMFWNPYTQHFTCPWCDHVFIAGILFYPVAARQGKRTGVPAPDCEPTSAEMAEMRRLAGGWFVAGGKPQQADGNLIVDAECSCPWQGTEPTCPLHGDVLARTSAGGESP